MPKSYERSLRIAELVKREVSLMLKDFAEDQSMADIVVTDARSKHVSQVQIYVYPAREMIREEMLDKLKQYTPLLRRKLGRCLRMRYVPELVFVYDDVIDNSQRIEDILTHHTV